MIKKSNTYYIPILFIIFTFHLVNNFVILKQDNVPLFFDEGGFYNLSVQYYRYLFSSPNIGKIFHHFHSISNFYPPLVFIERIPFFMLWGVSEDISILANIPFLFILIYFVFLIGKHIVDSKVGLLAAFLVSFYPGIYGFSRTNFVTIPMAAAVATSLYLLLRTENFINRKFSILLGISIGFGLLIKWLYLIYIIPSMTICFLTSFKKYKGKSFNKVFTNFLLAIAIGIVITLPWYLPNIKNLLPMLFSASYDNPNWVNFKVYFKTNPFRLALFKYVMLLENYHMFTYYTILFIYFLFRYVFSKNGSMKWALLASLAIPYLIFNFAIVEYYSGELCPRYIIPLFALVAILTAKGVMEIKKNIWKKSLIFSIVLIGLAQFYWIWISYGTIDRRIYTKENFQRRTTTGLLSPKEVNWKINGIIDTLRNNRISNRPSILIIPHTPLTSALAYKLELRRDSNLLMPLSAAFVEGEYQVIPQEKYKELVDKADFVLTQKNGRLTYDDAEWINKNLYLLVKEFEVQKTGFSLLKELEVEIDDRVRFLIYKRNKPEMSVSEPEGEGVLINAVDFDRGNLTYSKQFGLLIDGGESPAFVIYEVIIPKEGTYELWVRYATMKTRPVDTYFDGILRKSEALTVFTDGWSYADARWFKEIDLEVKKGRHLLKFIAQKTPFPHIDAIKLIYKQR